MARTCTCTLFIIILQLDIIQMKPSDKGQDKQQGPCVGMDCLHGVLMHNDEEQGEKHVAEDQYLRFKGVLDTANPQAGPLDAEAQMHGILMHGDSQAKHHDAEKDRLLPEQVLKAGPVDLSQVVHAGMHGEDGTHGKHQWDKETESRDTEMKGPFGEKFMHGVLMHGDANFEHSEDSDAETEINENKQKVGPKDAAEHLHGVLMHGDSEPGKEHSHEAPVQIKVDNSKIGPINDLHGVLMHGDSEPGKEHSHKDSVQTKEGNSKIGPNNDLHGVLMHGDSTVGHDHSHEDAKVEHDVFSDISKIKDLGLDKDLLKNIDLKKILEKDRQEYAEWILNNPQFQDESMMGSTLASVSDTILQDIELMKKRYLANSNQPDGIPNKKQDENPFTAEDARAVYDESVHADEGEDMRHDLELLGSTEPLNARHKAKLALLKSKLEK